MDEGDELDEALRMVARPPPPLSFPGRLGAYRLGSRLGRGGMGAVFEAFDEHLGRPVALKLMLPGGSTPEVRALAEARMAASVQHPGVAHVYEVGQEGPWCFVAMELIRGAPLSSRLDSLSRAEAESCGVQLFEALSAAHERGVVHRDLKPSNVMLTPEGRIKNPRLRSLTRVRRAGRRRRDARLRGAGGRCRDCG